MVESKYFISLIVMAVIGIFVPVAAIVIYKKKTKVKLLPFLVGAGVYVLFALMLESLPKSLLFNGTNSLSLAIISNPIIYAIVGGLLAGLFEEGGRFLAFKFVLKNEEEKENSIAYGLGHGGIEMILILAYTAITYLIIGYMINKGDVTNLFADANLTSEEMTLYVEQFITAIQSMDFSLVFISCLERIVALFLQVSLSVIVFYGVRKKDYKQIIFAVLMHMVADIPAALYQISTISSIVVTEVIITVITAGISYYALSLYKKYDVKELMNE